MIDLARPRKFVVRHAGSRALGDGDGARQTAARSRPPYAWDDDDASREEAASRRGVVDPLTLGWSPFTALVDQPGHSQNLLPEKHPVGEVARRPPASPPSSADIRLAGARPAGAARYVRDHRDQRQVDDDGADRPYPRAGRAALRGRQQYRPRCAGPRVAGRRHPRAGTLVLPARVAASPSAPTLPCGSTSPPDHIDRHGDLAGYVAAKANIFARQQGRRLRRNRHR